MLSLGTDRFELVRQVGEGSYGVVFQGHDRQTDRPVAIKVLFRGDDIAEERFEREATVLSELLHPAIVRYVAHGSSDQGRPYLVMEWLSGHTLERYLHEQRPVEDVLTLARRVVSGLTFAELRGVTHRDIKPANLFLVNGDANQAKIVDFGLARRRSDRQHITQTGYIVGTPLYMSPEQARGDPGIDERTDVFSLGSVLYACLSGEEPFHGASALATFAKICFDEPVPLERTAPQVPARLRDLVHAMLRKKREARPSLRDIAQELAEITTHPSGPSRLQLDVAEADSATMDIFVSDGGSARVGSSLQRRRRVAEPRILAAVFVRPTAVLSDATESHLSTVIARHGAKAERLRDGTRIVLPSQQLGASEQTVLAARCALSLRQVVPDVRLVICTGRAVLGDAQPLGELFERGAAMLTVAKPGTLRVDEASASLLETRFELSGNEATGRSLERERGGGDAPRTLLGLPTTFVGRERELSQLQLTFDECVDEKVARAVLVTAPAGGGKSRLLHELLERLRGVKARFTLLVGRGDSMRGGTQFSLLSSAIHGWAQLVSSDSIELKREKLCARLGSLLPAVRAAQIAPFLGEMIGVPFSENSSLQLRAARGDHQLMTDHMLASWLEFLEAVSSCEPLLICVEDLHWSDPASLRFLEAALRSSRERSLMVLALARPEVRELYPRLWAERDLTEIRLPKLGARACTRLLDALTAAQLTPQLREAMIERADGNPFFLEELVRGLKTNPGSDTLPETILAIVQARLDVLGEEPKLLIRAASVFGQSFRLVGVRALFGEDSAEFDFENTLELLCEREIIFQTGQVSEQEYVFRHALIRDVAYLLLHDEDRILGHRLAADWLERNADAPALLADHYERGNVPERAAHWYTRAAAQAFEAGSLDDVLRCGERAIACGVEGEPLGQLAALLAEARSYSEDDAGAAAWAERARASLQPGAPAWWRATQVSAVAYLRIGAVQELEALTAQMVKLYSPKLVMPEQALAVAYLLSECLRLTRDDLGEQLFKLLPHELPESLMGRPEGCLASARAMKAFRAGNLSEALRFGYVALAAQRAAGAMRDVADTLGLCGYFLHELGVYDDAEACLLEQTELGQRIGSSRDVSYGQVMCGSLYLRRGRLEEAETLLTAAEVSYGHRSMNSPQAEALGHLSGLWSARGDLARALDACERAMALEALEPVAKAYVQARTANIALLRGKLDEALARASNARDLLDGHHGSEFVAQVQLSYIESLLALGERKEAHQALQAALKWLVTQSLKIDDAALRQSFLHDVPEHARLHQLAETAVFLERTQTH